MPPKPLYDLSLIDQTRIVADQKAIYDLNPHRFEFMLLDGIFDVPADDIVAGYRDVRDDEFWVRGHIPGRPLFPGVLMIETAAQLVSYYVMRRSTAKGFLGFAAVDSVKFRGSVTPGCRLIMIGKMIEMRGRRCVGATQGYVNGEMVYEGIITGMWI